MDAYIYGPEWQASVDRASEAFRGYCEARACLRKYLRTKERHGVAAAKAEYAAYLKSLAALDRDHKPRRTPEAIAKLRADVRVIALHEGERITEEIQQAIHADAR